MNITLTGDLEEFVEKAVKAGHYRSPLDLIRESLWRMRETETVNSESLDDKIQLAINALANGERLTWDDCYPHWKQKIDKILKKKK